MEAPVQKILVLHILDQIGGSEQCWRLDWLLTESDILSDPTHDFCNTAKRSILYISGKKPGPFSKGWRGKVVQVLHRKSGGETDGEKNFMLLRRLEKEWTPIELNTWASKTISGCLEARV